MYNSIYPININYRKGNPYAGQSRSSSEKKDGSNTNLLSQSAQSDSYIPASNQINISQILMDFRNTIIAINAPQEVQDEVNIYIDLVDRESKKDNPSRDIIYSNLCNASKISDAFISGALGKNSNVVEGWISTIFKQNIDLKANPDDINPDFLLKFPQKAEQPATFVDNNIEASQVNNVENPLPIAKDEAPVVFENNDSSNIDALISDAQVQSVQEEQIDVQSSIEELEESDQIAENIFRNETVEVAQSSFSAFNDSDARAKVLFSQAKRVIGSNQGVSEALNLLNEALGFLNSNSNSNIRAAIHFERGRIFDLHDYVDYALRDYHEATKAVDLNLKANAYYKSGIIYDEFKEFNPALNNYLSSVAYSGQADNLSAQSKVLSRISEMYAKRFDAQSAHSYADLAIDAALDSGDSDAIANTYSSIAQNYRYLGDSKRALDNYKSALKEFSRNDESFMEMGYNYSQAAEVMRQLGNYAKAAKLQERSNQYYQKAQLFLDQQELAS